ncbi:septin-2B-like isoform X5 [Mytilus californianus]|uniref:septin-2B-like isoform X5 n=1 Tax=Mytilus californianus TaxID=6549 RepID=UPI0022457DC7|nr:septin-2B-like isoform X5 [Mytilus californianus]
MGDTTVHNDSLKLQLKKLRKVSLTDSEQLNMSGSSVRKKSESDNASLKSPVNCKHSFEDTKKLMSATKNNNNNNVSKDSEVSLVLDSSIESDEELTESSEILDVSLCIEEPDDQPKSPTDSLSRDCNGVQVTVNNNRGSTSSEEASSPAKAKKNCKLHKSESFGPIKLRKTGGEILLSRYHKFTCPEQPGYVGFANLPNQVHRKSVKKGFEFTLMVVGESGLGKSTLVNSLFLTDLYPERQIHSAAEKIKQTVKIDASTVEIEERGVKLRLTVVDTPGFGDSLNSVDCFKPIIQYVDDQFERYLQDESGLNRRHIIDNRVHCCFYFINPSGHGLRPLDITFMRAVHHKVNIVPVIAKADTLTKHEVQRLKKRVLDQIDEYGISIYPLPDCDSDEDEDYREQCRQLKEAVPFAVIGANTVIEVKGRKVRGRMYPWGVVEVENPEHCDFIKLRTMLITHMQDLQEVTQEVHYENFRADKLAGGGGQAVPKKVRGRQREEAVEQDKNRRPESMVGGDEKEKQLQEKDAELRRMQEMVARMQAEMEQQKRMAGTPGKQNGGIKTENV